MPLDTRSMMLLSAGVPVLAALGLGLGGTLAADAADPVAAMSASPNPLTFDDVAVGSSKDATVTLTSNGTAPVNVVDVTNAGRDQSQYSLTGDQCSGQTLAPGATCTVGVQFHPDTPKTLVTNLRFRSTNACTTFINVAGGGRTVVAAATPRAANCEIVTAPGSTSTVTTTRPAPATTVVAPAQTVTSSGAASSSPSTTTVTTATPPTTIAVAGVTASSPRICRSRRTITFNVKPKAGTTLAKVSFRVNGKLVSVVRKPKNGKIKSQLKLTGQPRSRVKVDIRTVTTSGQIATRTQYFVTCVPKRSTSN